MLQDLLIQRKSAILGTWRDLIFDTYHPETSKFLKKDDQFCNPVGYTISHEIEALYNGLMQRNYDKYFPSLDNIVKIRAVQDFTPSAATGFVFLLKKAIRKELTQELQSIEILQELLDFEGEIDRLALATFDVYVRCIEKIVEIRIAEIKKNSRLERENALDDGGIDT